MMWRMVEIQKDGKDSPTTNGSRPPGGWKRLDSDEKWRGRLGWYKRYPNVVRTADADGGPSGNATDFLSFLNSLTTNSHEAFVAAVCAVTGCRIP